MPKKVVNVRKHPRKNVNGSISDVRKHKRSKPEKKLVKKMVYKVPDIPKKEDISPIQNIIDKFFEKRTYIKGEEKEEFMELFKKSMKDLEWHRQYHKEEWKKVGDIMDEKDAQGEDPTMMEYMSRSYHSSKNMMLNDVFDLKKEILKYRKNVRRKKAEEFAEKHPPDNYGYQYDHLSKLIYEIALKYSKHENPDNDAWRTKSEVMNSSGIEDSLNMELGYINYYEDKIQNIKDGYEHMKGVKPSDIPKIHPWADKKRFVEYANDIKKEFEERGFDITKEEHKELREILKRYT